MANLLDTFITTLLAIALAAWLTLVVMYTLKKITWEIVLFAAYFGSECQENYFLFKARKQLEMAQWWVKVLEATES